MESIHVKEKSAESIHSDVSALYAEAAEKPQPGLCCPKDYHTEWTGHIPSDAFGHNYGCGSPVMKSDISNGEHVVDLGSGVGIDCFVAAKFVGATGKVIGVDMTDEMLAKANTYKKGVASNLGYDVVEFRKGNIESIPIEDNFADLIVSNCVINLSPDKKKVFTEMARVLKDGGRIIISDIVSDRDILPEDRDDKQKWAECYTGSLSAEAFLKLFKDVGLIAISQISESAWEEVNGYHFTSLTVAGYKSTSGEVCNYLGQYAVYLGPYAEVKDEDGHVFPRFSPVEICSDTAKKLSLGPYQNSFVITNPTVKSTSESNACAPGCGC